MGIHISISTEDGRLTQGDAQLLRALANTVFGDQNVRPGVSTPEPELEPEEKPKARRPRRTAAQKAADEAKTADEPADSESPAPEPAQADDSETAEGPTVADAVARAQVLVGKKKTAEVKAIVAEMGAERVSLLKPEQAAEFLRRAAELDAEPEDNGI